MCLQYAIWTMASNGHPKYGSYHDVFYKRARHYADSDEMRVRCYSAPSSVFMLIFGSRGTASTSSQSSMLKLGS